MKTVLITIEKLKSKYIIVYDKISSKLIKHARVIMVKAMNSINKSG